MNIDFGPESVFDFIFLRPHASLLKFIVFSIKCQDIVPIYSRTCIGKTCGMNEPEAR